MAEEGKPGQEPQTDPQDAGGGQEQDNQDTFPREYVVGLRQEAANYRVKAKELESKLSQFADYDQLKEAASKWQELEDKNKTDMEKLTEQLEQLRGERDRALQDMQDQRLRSAFISEASKLGFANPADAYALADKSGVEITKDGQVKGVDKAVKALEGRLPLAKPKAPSVDGGAGGAANAGKSIFTEMELREQAARLGVDAKLYAERGFGVKLSD